MTSRQTVIITIPLWMIAVAVFSIPGGRFLLFGSFCLLMVASMAWWLIFYSRGGRDEK